MLLRLNSACQNGPGAVSGWCEGKGRGAYSSGQPVTDAELREQRIDGADLHSGATATVSQFRGIDVILPIRRETRSLAGAFGLIVERTVPFELTH